MSCPNLVCLYLAIWKSHKSSAFSALAKLFLINNFHLQKISSQRKVYRYAALPAAPPPPHGVDLLYLLLFQTYLWTRVTKQSKSIRHEVPAKWKMELWNFTQKYFHILFTEFHFLFFKNELQEKRREGNYLLETCPPARCGSRTSLSNSDCAQQLWKGFRVRVWFLWRSKYNYQRQKTQNLKRFKSSREPERRRRRDRKMKVRVAQSRHRRRGSFMTAIKSAIF